MPSTNPVEAADPKKEAKPKRTDAEQREVIEKAIQKRERLAESQLEMARF